MIAEESFYRLLAELLVCVHFAFVLFVIFGGFLGVRRRAAMVIHLTAVVWAALIEFSGWTCPLTPLENWFRRQSGGAAYPSDFVSHYLLPILYPEGLTRQTQIALGTIVVVINLGIYARLWRPRAGSGRRPESRRQAIPKLPKKK